MTELKLQIREYPTPREEPPYQLDFLELIATLDLKISGKCEKHRTPEYEKKLKQKLADVFKQTLYGQIIQAINKAEYEAQSFCFDYSSANRTKEAFQQLRNSIPEITYD